MLNQIIHFFLHNRVLTLIILVVVIVWGLITLPFNWHGNLLPSNPVPVDAIPNLGDNQQLVAAEWPGRSPGDIQDQITYPLTAALLAVPGVKTIRSSSMFGMSFIYIIFEENIEFYWSRVRILEKLNSLPAGTLPDGVVPALGPDATALGQVFWYTLEGRNPQTGKPAGGWDPQELRSIQDFYVKYNLMAAEGVSEVASIGGFVKEYQVEVDPDAMRAYNVSLNEVAEAVQQSNLDIGAGTLEINKVEYYVRGIGYLKSTADLENSVVAVRDNATVRIKDVAFVTIGPEVRRGGLDKEGVEAVGGVVVVRHGANPLEVINNVKEAVAEMNSGLPQKTLADGSISKVMVVPFYDRTGLIKETLGTLETALQLEILISIIVVIVLVFNLRASVIISSILPVSVLATFIFMKYLGIDANIVALSGIAVAIGVMADVGVVFVESIVRYMDAEKAKGIIAKGTEFVNLIIKAVSEVSAAIFTALAATIVSFLPVFALQAQEGRLFKPLAYTKTFAILSALVLGIIIIPTLAYYVYSLRLDSRKWRKTANYGLVILGIILWIYSGIFLAVFLSLVGLNNLFTAERFGEKMTNLLNVGLTLLAAMIFLSAEWLPLGTGAGSFVNFFFTSLIIGLILGVLWLLVLFYEQILRWALANRLKFMLIPAFTLLFGLLAWKGMDKSFGFVARGFESLGWKSFTETRFWRNTTHLFPGMGQEFMPALNEGSFLLMPTTMPHTGIEENLRLIRILDKRVQNIPEVEMTVGKWGRAHSALDPAPIQMFENTINYRPEYVLDEESRRERFKVDKNGAFELINGEYYNPKRSFRIIPRDSLIADKNGKFFRQWRPEIKSPDDIWNEISRVTQLPGLTSAPKLQPIETRLVMLSTGMRAPMGIKISGPDLESIERSGLALEAALKEVPQIRPETVFFDRLVGTPYIEIHLNREKMARYGLTVVDLQNIIGAAVGGNPLTTTVEGRERYPVRLRYPRELRNDPEALGKILVATKIGAQIPLGEVAEIEYARGSQMIRSENTFPVGYVIFDKLAELAEVDVVEAADRFLKDRLSAGQLQLSEGTTFTFTGTFEQQQHAVKRLLLVIPLSLLAVLLILYFQFKSVTASLIHFSGVFVAFAGGFILLWLYSQPWFMDFSIGAMNMRDLFQMHDINLSIAVWVGFIALFGLSTNDGVILGTYIHDTFLERKPRTRDDIREAVVYAGKKRVRPAAMTVAIALIALLPVLTSTGKGAEIMVPIAIPTFGGMFIQSMTMFVIPVFQCWWREWAVRKKNQIQEQL